MQIPRDLTDRDFGLRWLIQREADMAISFIWKGQGLPWLFVNSKTNEIFTGTNPRIGPYYLTVDTEEGERRLPCPQIASLHVDVPWKFSIIRKQTGEDRI